jgi:enoyl-CoA hydratase/carnithine racemase
MAPFEQIATDLSERILTVTLNRPERLNAWTPTMARELIQAFDRADADDEVRAVIHHRRRTGFLRRRGPGGRRGDVRATRRRAGRDGAGGRH